MRSSTGLDLDVTALTDGAGSVRLEISGVGRGTLMRSLEQGALAHGDYGATRNGVEWLASGATEAGHELLRTAATPRPGLHASDQRRLAHLLIDAAWRATHPAQIVVHEGLLASSTPQYLYDGAGEVLALSPVACPEGAIIDALTVPVADGADLRWARNHLGEDEAQCYGAWEPCLVTDEGARLVTLILPASRRDVVRSPAPAESPHHMYRESVDPDADCADCGGLLLDPQHVFSSGVVVTPARPERHLVVTRHPALVQHLRETGVIGDGAEVLAHVESPEQIRGRHVIGVLPYHLGALTASVTEVPMALTPAIREEMTRGDLTIERVREVAGAPVRYVVRAWDERISVAQEVV